MEVYEAPKKQRPATVLAVVVVICCLVSGGLVGYFMCYYSTDVGDVDALQNQVTALQEQLAQIRKMGPLTDLLAMVPGVGRALKGVEVDGKEIGKIDAIINSMTPLERRKPSVIAGSRKKRIAKGSGVTVRDVNLLLKQFEQMKKMMKMMKKGPIPTLPGLRF